MDEPGLWTPLHVAAWNVIGALLDAGAKLNARDKRERTPLHKAAGRGHPEAVAALLDAGARPNAGDEDGRTPLHEAASWGHPEAVAALLDAGADPNARDKDGRTPLDEAASEDHPEVVAALLEAGERSPTAAGGRQLNIEPSRAVTSMARKKPEFGGNIGSVIALTT